MGRSRVGQPSNKRFFQRLLGPWISEQICCLTRFVWLPFAASLFLGSGPKATADDVLPRVTAANSARETSDKSVSGTVSAPSAITVLNDLIYDATQPEPLKCDVYLPAMNPLLDREVDRDSPGPHNPLPSKTPGTAASSPTDSPAAGLAQEPLRPAVVLIHGGAWSSGSKSLMLVHARQLAAAGIVSIAIDYRHAPQHLFPAQVDDVRSALLWVTDHADEFSIDLNRLGLFGYSAGGHLACLLASLSDEPLAVQLGTSSWAADDPRWQRLPVLRAVVAGGPPCDFRQLAPHDRTLEFFLGGTPAQLASRYASASPTAHASAGDCPICFIHGENDAVVLASDSRTMYESQRQQGVSSEYWPIAKQGHMLTFLHSQTRATMERFFRERFELTPASP